MANYPQYKTDASDSELYKTDLYSGGDSDVANSEVFTSAIDCTEKPHAVGEIKFDSSGTTDDLELTLYRSLDNSFDGDEIAIWSFTIESDGSEDIYATPDLANYGPGYYRFGLESSGATDTFDVDFELRQARYEIATS